MHRDTISHSVYLPNPLPLFVYPQGNSACMLVHVVTCVYVDTCSTCIYMCVCGYMQYMYMCVCGYMQYMYMCVCGYMQYMR